MSEFKIVKDVSYVTRIIRIEFKDVTVRLPRDRKDKRVNGVTLTYRDAKLYRVTLVSHRFPIRDYSMVEWEDIPYVFREIILRAKPA